MTGTGNSIGSLLFVAIFVGIFEILYLTFRHLSRQRVEMQLDKAIEKKDLPLARRILAELEKENTKILEKAQKAMQKEMQGKWTKSGKENVKGEFIKVEKALADNLDKCRTKVVALETRAF
jgi:hypothetical protein